MANTRHILTPETVINIVAIISITVLVIAGLVVIAVQTESSDKTGLLVGVGVTAIAGFMRRQQAPVGSTGQVQ